jgi:hypothetical protein
MDDLKLVALEIFKRHKPSTERIEYLGVGEQSVCYGSGHIVVLISREGNLQDSHDRDIQDDNGYALQKWLTATMADVGVRTPRIIEVGESPRPYALMQRVRGFSATAGSFTSETAVLKLFRKMGGEVRKINSVRTEGFGAFIASDYGKYCGRFATWNDYIDYSIKKYLFMGQPSREARKVRALFLEQGLISGTELDKIAAKLNASKGWTVQSVLTHYDNRLDNLILDGEEVTLVDWGLAYAGVGIRQELIKLFETEPYSMENPRVAAFLHGYGLPADECAAAIEGGKLMLALDGLVMSYGWAKDSAGLPGIRGWLRTIMKICDEW